ncbi:MAG: hypothetical protein Q8P78_02625, partial [bacterium]|nr:hypothetical protein [bacterium]
MGGKLHCFDKRLNLGLAVYFRVDRWGSWGYDKRMEGFDLQKFNELKQAAEEKYKIIGTIYSPALKADV